MRVTETCKIQSVFALDDSLWKAHIPISRLKNEILTAFSELLYSCSNIEEVILNLNLEGNELLGTEEK